MEPFISFEHVSFKYNEEDEPVLRNISLEIEKGSFVAILGHNGSGKSTLAKHLNAIFVPSYGRVTVNGLDTASEENHLKIRQQMGMVFQNPDNQIVSTLVEEDVAFALENLGVPSEEIRERVDKALKDVGMYEFREHAPHRLSGGQKQRVAIAGIVAMRPGCIVCDEPTAMLDPMGRREVLNTIQKLRTEYGITIILVTHHMNEAALADRLIVMNEGSVYMDGTPREIFGQAERLYSVGLAPPQTVELLYQLQQAGWDVPLDAMSTKDCAQAIHLLINGVDHAKVGS